MRTRHALAPGRRREEPNHGAACKHESDLAGVEAKVIAEEERHEAPRTRHRCEGQEVEQGHGLLLRY